MKILRRNSIVFLTFFLVFILAWSIRQYLHLLSSRYSIHCVIVGFFLCGVVLSQIISFFYVRNKFLYSILYICFFCSIVSIAIYHVFRQDIPRLVIVQIAEYIKKYDCASDRVIISYGRDRQLQYLIPDIPVFKDKSLNNFNPIHYERLIRRWKYYNLFAVARLDENIIINSKMPHMKHLIGLVERNKKKINVFFKEAMNAEIFDNMGESLTFKDSIFFENWSDTTVIFPRNNKNLLSRNLKYAQENNSINFPIHWQFFTINGFWDEKCNGNVQVLSVIDKNDIVHNSLLLSATRPIRIYSRWFEYKRDNLLQIKIVARSRGDSTTKLAVVFQDFIAAKRHQPVHEVLILPLKPGNFKIYTTKFDCCEMSGGIKMNLALDLYHGEAEIDSLSVVKL